MKASRTRVIFLGLGLAVFPVAARAWGTLGHKTVAILAERRLSPNAARQVELILGPGVSLADVAKCADDIKRKPVRCGSFLLSADRRSSGWHFIDIPITAAPTAATLRRYCGNHGRDDQCSVEQIKQELKTLKDPAATLSERQIALMFVVHLVGDLHQPLHNATDGDAGGNAKLVRFMATPHARKPTNLHHVWDGMLMKDSVVKKTRPEALAAALERDMADKDTAAWTKGNVIDAAALESFSIAKTRIYRAYALEGGANLGRDYQAEMQPIAFEQVEKAGVRLAFLLNQVWPGSVPPAQAVSAE
jgi:hypothetical protein